jgi:hypothetical protein
MDAAVETALIAVAQAMRAAVAPWWIIGSAAVVLLGGETAVADIDLLTGEFDARALAARLGVALAASDAHPRFRSRVFARWRRGDRDVEIMGGLMLAEEAGWAALVPATRVAVAVGDETVFVPAREEMIAILARFGRDKDHARVRILARCTGAPG